MTTNEYIRGVRHHSWPPFERRLWQRNYYERVIRNDAERTRIRSYIETNAMRWHLDHENPQRSGEDAFDRWLAEL